MRFCKSNAKPHPGFVVLDSPLTTYKGKKSVEDVKEIFKMRFRRFSVFIR